MADTRRLTRFNLTKRVLDLVLILITAPITVPVTAAAAVVVAVTMGHPIVYRQARLGLGDTEFTLFKFRTMNDRRDGNGELLPDRERLTRAGHLLRKLSLDELPQLINVARGDMSIVGPRPLFTRYLHFYSPLERRRHLVRPGITGLAQVAGRNSVLWEQRLRLDSEYADRASLPLDAVIIGRTLKQVVYSKGVSVIAGDSGDPLDVARALPTSELVRIEPFSEDDIPTRVAWVRHSDTRKYMQLPDSVTEESTTAWFHRSRRDPARIDMTAWDRRKGRRVGMAGLKEIAPAVGEFYVFIDPDAAGRGYGLEISKLVVGWALETRRFERIYLTVDKRNAAALKIYERLDFAVVDETAERVWMAVPRG